jgi:hypothetical protein
LRKNFSMEVPDLISAEVWEKVRVAMDGHEHWAAYNNTLLFIHEDDIQFFSNREDAEDYADFTVVRIDSLDDFKSKVESIIPGVNYVPAVASEAMMVEEGPGYFPKQILNERKIIIMNNENLEYLKNQLKFLGFDEGLSKQLEDKMKEGKPEFSLNASTEYGKDKMEAVIHFRHSDKEGQDNYFCNSYIATLKGEEKDKSQFIYVNNKGQNVTFKESCNLLNGRSVYKEITTREGNAYKAWLKIDHENNDQKTGYPKLRQFSDGYGFDLKEAVGRMPFKELEYPDQLKTLMKSLEKGNRPSAELVKDGGLVKVSLEANPQFKSLNMYDKEGEKMYYPMEKVPLKYEKVQTESMVNENAPAYGKDLLGKQKPGNGLLEKNKPERKRTAGQKIK